MCSNISVFSNLFSVLNMLFFSEMPISFVHTVIQWSFILSACQNPHRKETCHPYNLHRQVLRFCNYSCACIERSPSFSCICMWKLHALFNPLNNSTLGWKKQILNCYQQLECIFTDFLREVIVKVKKIPEILRTLCLGHLKNVPGSSLGSFCFLLHTECEEC